MESFAEVVSYHALVGKGVFIFMRISGTFVILFWPPHGRRWPLPKAVFEGSLQKWLCGSQEDGAAAISEWVINQKTWETLWINGVSPSGSLSSYIFLTKYFL